MKTTLQIVGIILTLFMLGTPAVSQAYTTGKHNNNKKIHSSMGTATKSTEPTTAKPATAPPKK